MTLPPRKNLLKLKTLIDEGRYLEKKKEPKETLGQFMGRYLEWCKGMHEKAGYSKNNRLRRIVGLLGADRPFARLTCADIEKYQAQRLQTPGPRGKIASKATVNRDISCLRHMLNKAVAWKVLDESPARGVRMLKESGRRLRYLTPGEIDRLLRVCSPTLKQVVMLALHTGMRKSEILKLKWEGVNLREGYIELVDQKNGEHSTIPLNTVAIETLNRIPQRIDSPYVFTGNIPSKPFYDLKRQFEKAVVDANLEGVTFHILRHTCASHLVMAGVDLATVREILRHKSFDMTLRYAHLSPEHKKSAINVLVPAYAGGADKAQFGG